MAGPPLHLLGDSSHAGNRVGPLVAMLRTLHENRERFFAALSGLEHDDMRLLRRWMQDRLVPTFKAAASNAFEDVEGGGLGRIWSESVSAATEGERELLVGLDEILALRCCAIAYDSVVELRVDDLVEWYEWDREEESTGGWRVCAGDPLPRSHGRFPLKLRPGLPDIGLLTPEQEPDRTRQLALAGQLADAHAVTLEARGNRATNLPITRIAVCHPGLTLRAMRRRFPSGPVDAGSAEQVAKALLRRALAEPIDVVVFAELSTDPEGYAALVDDWVAYASDVCSDAPPPTLVPGSIHTVEDGRRVNTSEIHFFDQETRTPRSTEPHRKYEAVRRSKSQLLENFEGIDPAPLALRLVLLGSETIGVVAAVVICRDALHHDLHALLAHVPVDLLLVPTLTPRVDSFAAFGHHAAVNLNTTMVCPNTVGSDASLAPRLEVDGVDGLRAGAVLASPALTSRSVWIGVPSETAGVLLHDFTAGVKTTWLSPIGTAP